LRREEIVNKEAVIKALESGQIFSYGLDANVMGNISIEDPYLKLPNVIITGHNASTTDKTIENTFNMAISNIQSFLNGNPKRLINKNF